MGTLTRKQREVREREQMLLDVSRSMLLESGFAGLTMDDLAARTEYSKGVIYQHFKSKEDVVAALAVQSLAERKARFQKAVEFNGRTREKMMAIGIAEELFVRLHPHHFHTELIIKMGALHERASAERLEQLIAAECGCFDIVQVVVAKALEAGDLVLPKHIQPADVVLGLWAINFGCFTILQTGAKLLSQHGITAPYGTVRTACHALLDGFNWQPLSSEWDYGNTQQRVLREVFPEECLKAGLG